MLATAHFVEVVHRRRWILHRGSDFAAVIDWVHGPYRTPKQPFHQHTTAASAQHLNIRFPVFRDTIHFVLPSAHSTNRVQPPSTALVEWPGCRSTPGDSVWASAAQGLEVPSPPPCRSPRVEVRGSGGQEHRCNLFDLVECLFL